ncbi:CRISPR-associated protein Cas2 [Peptostreptococcus russellii]|uniref:CRISPR-associated endoribonuclease Cas2 n=1 Tax=Peptostreptococcus russellii TaxID=215200 RepID=A0A2P7Q2W0_9FIRM|nr:CRISPR-associated endonuclease Cas2 [Peptostreptococcus russellii]PSJ32303.1 CRISPR-associated protein Cas2 [Peptostreptococcus russellii]
MYIILVYDIALDENGAKVWRDTFKICKRYLTHVQNSVFEGEVSKSQLFELKKAFKKVIRKDKDSLIIFSSRDQRWLDKDIFGIYNEDMDNFI